MMIRKVYKYVGALCVVLAFGVALFAQQPSVEPRIAGLEGNEEYMTLLREDAQLQLRDDSVSIAVEQARRELRDNPAERQRLSQVILQLENRIFEIRNAKGRVADRINTIEQDWVLANLSKGGSVQVQAPVQSAIPEVPESQKRRNLVDNLYFRNELSAEDYAALRKAQQQEFVAVDYVNRYAANYQTIREIADSYAQATTESEALELYGKYTTLQGLNKVLSDSLATTWNAIFDNKSYAYGYLLEKLGKDELLAREEEQLSAAARQLTAIQEQVSSEALADYLLRKRVLTEYEMSVADVLTLAAAKDSLKGVAAQLAAVEVRMPKIEVVERNFLDYDSIRFSVAQQYTYQHPIPECRIYARGTIYRLLLGVFNSKRAASTFRGAYPLSYLVDEAGKWNYYAGGYATREEAEQAQKMLKTRGFARPEIVVWNDGELSNFSRDAEAATINYRIEISGAETLSDEIKELIKTDAEGRELSRVGQQLFVIGAFDDRGVAEQLAATIREKDSALEIKVAEIAK